MFNKLATSIVMTVVTGLTPILMAAAPILAAEPSAPAAAPATGLEQAGGPLNGTIQIPAKGSQWFKFKYHYDNSDEDNDPTQAVVMVKSESTGAIRFEVWTPGRMRYVQYDADDTEQENGKITPLGYGTPQVTDTVRDRNADGIYDEDQLLNEQTLVWAGSQKASDTFYVLVKNTSSAPINYTISISGSDVSY